MIHVCIFFLKICLVDFFILLCSVKAGGMRIKQNTKPHEKSPEMTPEEEEEYGPATR